MSTTTTKKKAATTSATTGFDLDGLLKTAAVKASATSTSKRTETINDPELTQAISEMSIYKTIEDQAKAKKEAARDTILGIIKAPFAKAMTQDDGSFMASDGADASAMILPINGATKVKSEEEANEINEFFGKCLVEKKTTLEFNMEILLKYKDTIAKSIGMMDIPAADKNALLVPKAEFKYTEDIPTAIKALPTEEKRLQAMELTNMTFQVKNPKINGQTLPDVQALVEADK
jgi:hypothetical protein